MAESVDAADLKSVVRKDVRVQVPPWAPFFLINELFSGMDDTIVSLQIFLQMNGVESIAL